VQYFILAFWLFYLQTHLQFFDSVLCSVKRCKLYTLLLLLLLLLFLFYFFQMGDTSEEVKMENL
ncbi:MAG: hypothetical protein K7J15_04735, partial [Candidatus Regiella insecticola]|nr:hypothetical protein [Candidatus Regiella insecticola]MCX2959694.1 hypothetical protein [Serratia symbiotica]